MPPQAPFSAATTPARCSERVIKPRQRRSGRGARCRCTAADAHAQTSGKTSDDVIVVGAGPAGALAAINLAAAGYNVKVYDRLGDPRRATGRAARAYIIALLQRGVDALRASRVELPTDDGVMYKGEVFHNTDGTANVGRSAPGNFGFERIELASFLIDRAESMFPGKIRFEYHHEFVDVDWTQRIATFDSGGQRVQQRYAMLVGADGVNSKVRAAMQRRDPRMHVEVLDSNREYKSYFGMRDAGDIEPADMQNRPGKAIHVWRSNRPLTSFSTHFNPDDGTYAGTLRLAKGEFNVYTTADDLETIMRQNFTGIPEHWIRPIAEMLVDAPVGSGGKVVRCSTITAPRAVLIGDAAHAVTPTFGQGANAALQAAATLAQCLQDAGEDIDRVCTLYEQRWLPEAQALADLESAAYTFIMKKQVSWTLLQVALHIVVGSALHAALPSSFDRPAALKLGSGVRYSDVLASARRDFATVVTATVVAAVAVAGVLLQRTTS